MKFGNKLRQCMWCAMLSCYRREESQMKLDTTHRGKTMMLLSLFVLSIETNIEFQIETKTANQTYPAIYGDFVVWQNHCK
jgi:hypothetical protein